MVTAQRRETNLQQTPISITAFSSEEMELRNMTEGRDLTINVPNFAMGGGISEERGAQLFMRGVPGVGIYLDGVWQGNTGALFANFLQMERVEVLRGPQGTLFGRHTNGGAIQYVTEQPADEFGVSAEIEIGSYDRRQIAATIDAPLTDTLRTKWLVARQTSDGYIESITAPIDFGGQDDMIFRGDVLWEPTNNLSVRFVYQDADQVTSSARYTKIYIPEHPLILAYNVAVQNPAFLRVNGGTLPNSTFTPRDQNAGEGRVGLYENTMEIGDDALAFDSRDAVLTVTWDFTDRLTLRSITGATEIDSQTFVDFDSTEFQQFVDDNFDREEEFSQELHLTGDNFDGRVNWLVGGYYRKTKLRDRNYRWTMPEFYVPTGTTSARCRQLPCQAPNPAMVSYVRAWGLANDPASCLDNNPATNPPGANCMSNFSPLNLYTDSMGGGEDVDRALFGEVNVGVTEKLSAIVGVRFTQHDGREFTITPTSGFRPYEPRGPIVGDLFEGTIVQTVHDPKLATISTPRFALQYELNDDLMVYFSYSEGFTAGAVNIVEVIGEVVLDPEVLATKELGLRSDWFDGMLRYNGTLFHSRWTGLRVNNRIPDPNNPGLILPFAYQTSTGVAEVSGTEHELIYAPNESWRVNASLATLDTEYIDVGDPAVSPVRIGDTFAYAPELSYSIGVTRFWSLQTGGQLTVRADYGWKDKYQKDSAPIRQTIDGEPAYGLLNARVVYEFPDRDWRVSLWGKNLTDERYDSGGVKADATGVEFATLARPKEYGVSFNINL